MRVETDARFVPDAILPEQPGNTRSARSESPLERRFQPFAVGGDGVRQTARSSPDIVKVVALAERQPVERRYWFGQRPMHGTPIEGGNLGAVTRQAVRRFGAESREDPEEYESCPKHAYACRLL